MMGAQCCGGGGGGGSGDEDSEDNLSLPQHDFNLRDNWAEADKSSLDLQEVLENNVFVEKYKTLGGRAADHIDVDWRKRFGSDLFPIVADSAVKRRLPA